MLLGINPITFALLMQCCILSYRNTSFFVRYIYCSSKGFDLDQKLVPCTKAIEVSCFAIAESPKANNMMWENELTSTCANPVTLLTLLHGEQIISGPED